MRSLEESTTRWEETLRHTSSSFAQLQRAVKFNGPDSPCIKGSRALCWKTFLLFRDAAPADWSQILLGSRNAYASLQERYLHYIKHPELLTQLTVDPLADDPESPWDSFRQDELIRAEILQDVRRLPDEPFYHRETTQELILDVLFIWCKVNPDVGGYRQGMHELLAPIVLVLHQDAVDPSVVGETANTAVDPVMAGVLDSTFTEHDAFALFSMVMARAKGFYETGDSASNGFTSSYGSPEQNTIVAISKEIHEVTLMRVDPELATHLKNIEILPQIFLIRWIRLLFGREFPPEQQLVLWDTIFAFDPNLDLIPLVCVAMLIRIRWQLLEADYSVALQLLLKYPAPEAPHGPHTFVDDAVYLKDHLDFSGGTSLILKYTGREPSAQPSAKTTNSLRPSTPTFAGLGLRQRTLGARSPLTSPSRFIPNINNRESVEAIFQGAAKNVLERGEKLGINQAVRDAMGEIKRNMQGFQEARSGASQRSPTRSTNTVAQMERRNRRLAAMLDDTVVALRALATPGTDDVKDAAAEAVELAAAKIQFVKVYLEDASLSLPEDGAISSLPVLHHEQKQRQPPGVNALSFTSKKENAHNPLVAVDKTVVTMSTATHEVDLASPSPSRPGPIVLESPNPNQHDIGDRMDTDHPMTSPALPTVAQSPPPQPVFTRPGAPIPTRSTLAQSSFAWMLDPDTTSPSSSISSKKQYLAAPSSNSSSSKAGHRGSRGGSNSRDRNAFLFGEVTSSSGSGGDESGDRDRRYPVTSDEIFGLEPLRKALPKAKGANLTGMREESPL